MRTSLRRVLAAILAAVCLSGLVGGCCNRSSAPDAHADARRAAAEKQMRDQKVGD